MNRKKTLIALIIMIALVASMSTYAEDDNVVYDLKQLTDRLHEENLDILKMNNNTKVMKLKYDKSLDDYDDLEEAVEDVGDSLEIAKINKEQAREIYLKAKKSDRQFELAKLDMREQIYESTLDAYKDVVKQEMGVIGTMEQLKLQIEQGDRQQEVLKLTEENELKNSYYNLYILNREIELLKTDIENINKQKEIEKTRQELDMSTDEELQSIKDTINTMQLTLQQLENQKELAKESLKTKINMPVEEELNIEWEISDVDESVDYSLADLISEFKENSLELASLEKNIEIKDIILEKSHEAYDDVEGNEVNLALLELKNSELDKQINERDMELYVKQAYFDFKTKKLDLFVKKVSNQYYIEKEKNLEARYEQGSISELQYDMEMQQLKRDKFESDKAKINYLLAKSKLELISEGIMLMGGSM
ncbi:TolC family protein [Sporosalibacterium faouarense]|uniref:TolC family protein n=1 Tax=Sporosalibacterium faouarense TaxID=516123 RepID=UPI00192BFABE|nr:TolC family protein [Sporosalibacterium faouarense]